MRAQEDWRGRMLGNYGPPSQNHAPAHSTVSFLASTAPSCWPTRGYRRQPRLSLAPLSDAPLSGLKSRPGVLSSFARAPTLESDDRPDSLYQSERPRSLEESVDRSQCAGPCERHHEPRAALLQRIEDQHRCDREQAKECQAVHGLNIAHPENRCHLTRQGGPSEQSRAAREGSGNDRAVPRVLGRAERGRRRRARRTKSSNSARMPQRSARSPIRAFRRWVPRKFRERLPAAAA